MYDTKESCFAVLYGRSRNRS